MVSAVDQQRVCALLTEAMTVICKNGLTFNSKFCIEGLLGITMDDSKMFLVNIRETVHKAQPGVSKQHKSDSMSKAGMLVGGRPMMQPQQGLRTGSPIGLGRPGMGVNPGNQQMMQQRRRVGPQPQTLIPAKRPMMSPGQVPPGMKGGPGGGGGGGGAGGGAGGGGGNASMPQEWAALIQLQQQQHKPPGPPGLPGLPTLPTTLGLSRGRGRPPTARRGGFYRGGMQARGPVPGPGDAPLRSPTRRNSQGGIDLEAREEMERKAAEQAKSRSERLQRRQAVMSGDILLKMDDMSSEKGSVDTEGSTEEKPTTESDTQDANTEDTGTEDTGTDNGKTSAHDNEGHDNDGDDDGGDDDEETAQGSTEDKEQTEPSDNGDNKDATPKDEPENENSTEGGKDENKEGDGSWLLSNSNWLLGDLEAPTNADEKGEKSDTG